MRDHKDEDCLWISQTRPSHPVVKVPENGPNRAEYRMIGGQRLVSDLQDSSFTFHRVG